MTSRRDFLRRGSIALAGGLLLGDAALEAFERLTHRKVWAGHTFEEKRQAFEVYLNKRLDVEVRRMINGIDAYTFGQPCGLLASQELPIGYLVVDPPNMRWQEAPLARLVRKS